MEQTPKPKSYSKLFDNSFWEDYENYGDDDDDDEDDLPPLIKGVKNPPPELNLFTNSSKMPTAFKSEVTNPNVQGPLDPEGQLKLIWANRQMAETIEVQARVIAEMSLELGEMRRKTWATGGNSPASRQAPSELPTLPMKAAPVAKEQVKPNAGSADIARRLVDLENVVKEVKAEGAKMKELEKKVAEMVSALEIQRENSKSDVLGKLEARIVALEGFQRDMESVERLKTAELGTLALRMNDFTEAKRRLVSMQKLQLEQTPGMLACLSSRVGGLEWFRGKVDAMKLEELRASVDEMSGTVAEVNGTMEDLDARVQTLEIGEGSWEELDQGVNGE